MGMKWIHVAVVASIVGCVSTLLVVFIFRWCHKRKHTNFVEPNSLARMESLQPSQLDHHKGSTKGKNHYGTRNLFSWVDHPYLAAHAVENGWSRFAFSTYDYYIPSISKRLGFLGLSAAPAPAPVSGYYGRESEAEISWEVYQGCAELMQKVRMKPGLKKSHQSKNNSSFMNVDSVIRTSLPLPGPPLGNYAFPQEAYFEITILYSCVDDYESVGKSREGEKTKLLLIQGKSNSKENSDDMVHVTSNNNSNNKINSVEEMKVESKESRKSEYVMFSLGLTTGGSVPLKVPGSYPGSIGFNSNGSVYLNGMKLVFESEKAEWVGTDRVIGCGFDPRQKKVFFTLDSELVHVIHCQQEEFGTPLYPVMAANINIMVLVNFGQSAFKYAPANAQRTPNPCITASLVSSPADTLAYDDSKELFSMRRIGSQWFNRFTTIGRHNNGNNNNRATEYDEESEADLFEIVLDGSGKSANATSS